MVLADEGNNKNGADDCSDVMVSLEGDSRTAFLGHNEDNTADTVNTTYFVQAKLVRLPHFCVLSLECELLKACKSSA